ncbi:MAG: hypothetical protein ACFB0B_15300 [Thermonemataceae bacterium]
MLRIIAIQDDIEEPFDVFGDEKLALNFAASKLTDPSAIQANYSLSYKLPPTAKNIRKFEYAHVLAANSQAPYTSIDVRVEKEGVDIIQQGVLVLDESVFEDGQLEHYQINIYSGNFDFFEALGDLTLQDLNLSDGNHTWNRDSTSAGRNNTWEDIYVYALVYNGWARESTGRPFYQVYPNVFARAIFEKIFEEQGYSYIGSFPTEFDTYLIPFTNDSVEPQESQFEDYKNAGSVLAKLNVNQDPPLVQGEKIRFRDDFSDSFDALAQWDNVNYEFRVQRDAFFSLNISINLIVRDENNADVTLRVIKFSGGTGTNIYEDRFEYANVGTAGRIETINFQNLALRTNDVVIVQIVNNFGLPRIVPENTFFEATPTEGLYDDSTWRISSNLPDIKQKDFVKAILQLFGKLSTYDNLNRLNFFSLDEIASLDNAVDWSSKLDVSKKKTLSYAKSDLARRNYVQYNNGTSARGLISTSNDNLPAERVMIELPFEYAPDVTKSVRTSLVEIAETQVTDEGITSRRIRANPKLIRLTNTVYDNYRVPDSEGIGINLVDLRTTTFVDLSDNVDNYYNAFGELVEDMQVLTAYFLLNEIDIQNLDFSRLVYVDAYKAYFYVEEIEQWVDRSKSVKVRLIKY